MDAPGEAAEERQGEAMKKAKAKVNGKWRAEFAGSPFHQARLMYEDTQYGMTFRMPLGERIARLLNADDAVKTERRKKKARKR